jgi:hypothetical protein
MTQFAKDLITGRCGWDRRIEERTAVVDHGPRQLGNWWRLRWQIRLGFIRVRDQVPRLAENFSKDLRKFGEPYLVIPDRNGLISLAAISHLHA